MTIEEIFKLGWKKGYSDALNDAPGYSADKAWIDFRAEQIKKERGTLTSVEYYNHNMDLLNKKEKEKNLPQNLKCPECSGEMVSRNGKFGTFWGCKKFPVCEGTRDVNGLSKQDKKGFR